MWVFGRMENGVGVECIMMRGVPFWAMLFGSRFLILSLKFVRRICVGNE